MSIPLLTKGYLGGATVNKYRMVKFSAANTVIQATAETDAIIGVCGELDITSGAMGDVILAGIAEVESYDTITRGDLVTSDSVGRAVKVTDTMIASVTIHYLGIALESSVAGDIFQVLVVPGKLSKLDGIEATAAEVNTLHDVTAGTVTASKALVCGANKNLNTLTIADGGLCLGSGAGTAIAATAAEINRACDVSARLVNCTASTLTLSEATHDGKIVTLNRAAGIAVTLPAATGSGAKFRLFVGTTVTSNTTTIKVADASTTMVGFAAVYQDGGNTALMIEAGGTDDTITLDGSTTGGIIGDMIELIDIATNLWFVDVKISATGTEASPFSATVS